MPKHINNRKTILFMSIYYLMKKEWKIYCLMSSIIYIEEMSKPTEHIQIKKHKNKEYRCLCFHSVRLKMNNEEVTKKIFDITKKWEKNKKILFIGKKFDTVKKGNYDKQDYFFLSPAWLNIVISECGNIPNEYSLKTAIKRIEHLKQYGIIPINLNKNLFNLLLINKKIAAGAFILSLDLECRGVQSGRPSLCMSEKYKDFLEFMLKVAKKWSWTNNSHLSPVKVDYSRNLGINASPQYEFRINIKGLKEIYSLAGPLADSFKDKCIKFHIKRSNHFMKMGRTIKKGESKKNILKQLKKEKNLTTTHLQFGAGIGTDVILDHLHNLEKEGKIKKERMGKRYIWNLN